MFLFDEDPTILNEHTRSCEPVLLDYSFRILTWSTQRFAKWENGWFMFLFTQVCTCNFPKVLVIFYVPHVISVKTSKWLEFEIRPPVMLYFVSVRQ